MRDPGKDALEALAFSGLNPSTAGRLLSTARPEVVQARARSRMRDDEARFDVSADDRRNQLAALGARFVARGDVEFPEWLAGMPDAPWWLFVTGSLAEAPGIAVVGSRRATAYGLEVAQRIGTVLAQAGVSVVSGLAAGIDGAAHRGALIGGGHTVAVLGSGIDVVYPARHRSLAGWIMRSGGAMISEYPPGAAPEPWRFPLRNRIVSGLSRGVVVVEAAEKSGALITARHALEQNLDVYAVPGDIGRPTSRGCNLLIRDGAHPLTDPHELIESLGFGSAVSPSCEVLGLAPGDAVAIDELVERSEDPMGVLAQLGRLELAGRVVVRDGIVSALPANRTAPP